MITIYHNPRCSKSRETLALIEQIAADEQLPLECVDYLKTPLTTAQLAELHQQLGGDFQAMLRNNEDEYAALHLAQADQNTAFTAIVQHPKLLQRPIVTYQGKAAIGRPPESVLSLFKKV